MRIIIFLFFLGQTILFPQKLMKYNFYDSISLKDFTQGVKDSEKYFKNSRDFFVGMTILPAIVSYTQKVGDKRLINLNNPNNDFLFTNKNYYLGYKKKSNLLKKRAIRQGTLATVTGYTIVFPLLVTILILSII